MFSRSTDATSMPNSRMALTFMGLLVSSRTTRDAEVGENGCARGILTCVDRQAELDLRVDGVEAAVLQLVGLQLVEQPHSPALVSAQVDHDAALGRHLGERPLELGPAVATLRAEHVTREALGVQAHQRRWSLVSQGADQGHVLRTRDQVAVAEQVEHAVRSGQPGPRLTLDAVVPLSPLDQLGDGDDRQVVLGAQVEDGRQPHHRPVVVHQLGDDTHRLETGQRAQVDGRLGVTRTLQHSAGPGPQREHVAGSRQVGDLGVRGRPGAAACAPGPPR